MTKLKLTLFAILVGGNLFCYAQPEILPLYPDGKIPLSKPCNLVEIFDTTTDGRPNFYKNITSPSLYYWKTYKPNPNRNAVLVIPGGSYSFVSMENEGRKVAERLSSEGFEVFYCHRVFGNDVSPSMLLRLWSMIRWSEMFSRSQFLIHQLRLEQRKRWLL